MQKALIVIALVITAGCAQKAPPSLSPAGVVTWQANQALLVLDSVQHSAIGLNKIQRCDAAQVCKPMLSDANTRLVIDIVADSVNTIRAVPSGWKATTVAGLRAVSSRLDAEGQQVIAAYVQAGLTVLESIVA